MSKSGGGKGHGTKMDDAAASRIQSAAAKDSASSSAKSGFAPRAQSAAAKNDPTDDKK